MTSILDQIQPAVDIDAARIEFAELIFREVREAPLPGDGEALKRVCEILSIPLNDFFKKHAHIARNLHLTEARAEQLPIVMAKFDRIDEKIRAVKLKVPMPSVDADGYRKANAAVRQLQGERVGLINQRHAAERAIKQIEKWERELFWMKHFRALQAAEVEPAVGKVPVKKKKAPAKTKRK